MQGEAFFYVSYTSSLQITHWQSHRKNYSAFYSELQYGSDKHYSDVF